MEKSMKNFDIQGIELLVPREQAFAFIADPAQLPRWTSAFASVNNGRAVMRTPGGAVEIGLSVQTSRERGTVDWDFPTTALDVVTMGTYGQLGWFRRPGAKQRRQALACLEQVDMTEFAGRQIRQLSGGQQQRVFLARALAQDAKIYFMDEPFAGVDAATEQAIVRVLQSLRQSGKTVLVVHHELQTVTEYFDYLILINMRLVAAGPTETTFTKKNLHTTYGGRLTILDEAAEAVRMR
jgi:manganese/zinc/iron transport system ATP- binding protein